MKPQEILHPPSTYLLSKFGSFSFASLELSGILLVPQRGVKICLWLSLLPISELFQVVC